LIFPGTKPAELLKKPLDKTGIRVYVVTTGNRVTKDDYGDVVPTKDNAKHVPDPNDLTDVVPSVVDKIRKDIKKRKFLYSFKGMEFEIK
jgi:hypothetical protein